MNLENYKNKYEKFGTVMVPFENSNCPLTSEDIDELSNCCEKVEKEFVSIGDAGEKNFVHVGRFMTDIKKPEVVKNNFSEKVINILSKVTIKKFIKSVIGCDEENNQLSCIDFSRIKGHKPFDVNLKWYIDLKEQIKQTN